MLNKSNFEIAKLCEKASKEPGHIYHGIRVAPNQTITTDGHVLLKISGIGDPEDFEPFTLPIGVAVKIANALPSGSKVPSLNQTEIKHVKGSTDARISVANLDVDQEADRNVYKAQPPRAHFPDIKQAIPDSDGAVVEMCLDLDLLIPLLEQIRKFHGKQDRKKKKIRRTATFKFYEPTPRYDSGAPQRIDAMNAQGQELTAVIMPCRS